MPFEDSNGSSRLVRMVGMKCRKILVYAQLPYATFTATGWAAGLGWGID